MCTRLLGQLEVGVVPHLVPPLLKYVGSSSIAEVLECPVT